jgi:hypothetical protein
MRRVVNDRVKISLGASPVSRGVARKPPAQTAAPVAPDKLDALVDALGKAVSRKSTGDRSPSVSWP